MVKSSVHLKYDVIVMIRSKNEPKQSVHVILARTLTGVQGYI